MLPPEFAGSRVVAGGTCCNDFGDKVTPRDIADYSVVVPIVDEVDQIAEYQKRRISGSDTAKGSDRSVHVGDQSNQVESSSAASATPR